MSAVVTAPAADEYRGAQPPVGTMNMIEAQRSFLGIARFYCDNKSGATQREGYVAAMDTVIKLGKEAVAAGRTKHATDYRTMYRAGRDFLAAL